MFAARLLLLVALAAPALARDAAPFRPATPSEQRARAAVVHADYRFDDLLWENDRTAHRIYGRRLEAEEPPSGSGIDAWGKSVPWPFMDRQLRTGDQHADHGEGIDFYNVGGGRGVGGLGVWDDNKLWVSRNYARYRILDAGPRVADFTVEYDPWPVGVGRSVSETRRITLPAGTPFTRMVSTIRASDNRPLLIGIGISKRATDARADGSFHADAATGRFTWWSPEDPKHGALGVALLIDPASIERVAADADNRLVLVRVTPGRPFVYYVGSTWSRGIGARTEAAWRGEVAAAIPDFRPPD